MVTLFGSVQDAVYSVVWRHSTGNGFNGYEEAIYYLTSKDVLAKLKGDVAESGLDWPEGSNDTAIEFAIDKVIEELRARIQEAETEAWTEMRMTLGSCS